MFKKSKKRIARGWDDPHCETPQMGTFPRIFKRDFTDLLTAANCRLTVFNKGYFYLSGFFRTDDDRLYYWSIDDVRDGNLDRILIRTAENEKDYTGGSNRWIRIGENEVNQLKNIIGE